MELGARQAVGVLTSICDFSKQGVRCTISVNHKHSSNSSLSKSSACTRRVIPQDLERRCRFPGDLFHLISWLRPTIQVSCAQKLCMVSHRRTNCKRIDARAAVKPSTAKAKALEPTYYKKAPLAIEKQLNDVDCSITLNAANSSESTCQTSARHAKYPTGDYDTLALKRESNSVGTVTRLFGL